MHNLEADEKEPQSIQQLCSEARKGDEPVVWLDDD